MERLPNELVRDIFYEVTTPPETKLNDSRIFDDESPWLLMRAPYDLAAVSRRWREICLTAPDAWTYILAIHHRESHWCTDLVRQKLKRSGTRPIDIYLYDIIDIAELRDSVELLLEHTDRWRRLRLSLQDWHMEEIDLDIVRAWMGNIMPILEEFTLVGSVTDYYRLADNEYDPQHPQLLHSPRLRRLTSHLICIIPADKMDSLTYLSISLRDVDERPLWDTLVITPVLEQLDIYFPRPRNAEEDVVETGGIRPQQDITLSRLTHLGLFGCPGWDAPWADNVHLPNLSHLTVSIEACNYWLNRVFNKHRTANLHVVITTVEFASSGSLGAAEAAALAILQNVEALELARLQTMMLEVERGPSFFEDLVRRAREDESHWAARLPRLVMRNCTFDLDACKALADYAQMRNDPTRTRQEAKTQGLTIEWIDSKLLCQEKPGWFEQVQDVFTGADISEGT